jgi:ribosome recycling factor
LNANIGLNPQNNGEIVILNIPPLTEERRKELVRMAKSEGEEAKVGIRAVRKSGMDEVKKMEKNGLSEDNCKTLEADIQKIVESYNEIIENKVLQKETDIMKV